MTLYSFPSHYEKASDAFTVSTADGQKIGVYGCDVSAFPLNQVWPGYQRPFEQTEPTSYISLGSDEPVTLTITPKKAFASVTVRPLSHKITPKVQDGHITLTFPGPGQYSVEMDDVHHVLTVFINPEKDFGIEETDDVLYFAPGVHYLDKVTELCDDQTVYIAPVQSYTAASAPPKRRISAFWAMVCWTTPAFSAAKALLCRSPTAKTCWSRALPWSIPPAGHCIFPAAPT